MTVQSGTTKYNCVITNVDLDATTAQGVPSPIVEGAIKGKIIQLSIYDTPVAFRWPVVGETWTVYQQNGSWYLGSTWEHTDFQNVNPGDAIINTPTGLIYLLTNNGLETLPTDAEVENLIDTAIAPLAPKASPALTGIPTAPTATAGTNTSQIATTEFVETAIADVSGGGGTYIYNQLSASNVWTINHNLGYYPPVFTQDSAGTEVIGDINYVNSDTLTITFSYAESGTAYLAK